MKYFWKIAPSLGFLFFIGACLMFAINAFALIAALFGVMRPFNYFQYLRIPFWSVVLPALGILMFFPLALRQAFTFNSAPEKVRAAEPVDWRRIIRQWRNRFHIKPV